MKELYKLALQQGYEKYIRIGVNVSYLTKIPATLPSKKDDSSYGR